ncbi:hypothetical protein HYX58_06110 [Candidatus Dependentiae bacterium]|nr:hypothetical protein [Candidatus Dependentiae bacterium]
MKKIFCVVLLSAHLTNAMTGKTEVHEVIDPLTGDAAYNLSIEKCKSGDYHSALLLRCSARFLRESEIACAEKLESFGEKEELVLLNYDWLDGRWIQAVGQGPATQYANYVAKLGAEKINHYGKLEVEKLQGKNFPDPKWVFMRLKPKEEREAARKQLFEKYLIDSNKVTNKN